MVTKQLPISLMKILQKSVKTSTYVVFVRYALGEGIEKRQDDFVAEVMASVGK